MTPETSKLTKLGMQIKKVNLKKGSHYINLNTKIVIAPAGKILETFEKDPGLIKTHFS